MSSTVPGDPDPTEPMKEVWFAGCHADVGGSAVKDAVRDSLANIPLRWMVKEVMISQCGIRFDREALKEAGIPTLDDHTRPAAEQNRTEGPETEPGVPLASSSSPGEDGSGEHAIRGGEGINVEAQGFPQDQEALADIHDELKIHWSWWLLELMPTKFGWQECKPDGTWKWEHKWRYAIANVTL